MILLNFEAGLVIDGQFFLYSSVIVQKNEWCFFLANFTDLSKSGHVFYNVVDSWHFQLGLFGKRCDQMNLSKFDAFDVNPSL